MVYASLIGSVILSLDASAQTNLVNSNNYTGRIFHVTSQMILKQGVYFRAIAFTDNSKIVFLECDQKDDSIILNKKFSGESRFKLKELIKNGNGSLKACLENISLE
jgi:hypothetical protein|tara:strand:- start:1106 stop:1423 length:318 start_codon:yes stop_codon:yes gene_type:complete